MTLAFGEIEIYALNSAGFQARGFDNGIDFLNQLKVEKPDLVLLDIMLPQMNGVEILSKIKGDPELESIPIIMATAKGSEMEKVQSLSLGADDYLVKPFGMMEMVSRVNPEKKEANPAIPRNFHKLGGPFCACRLPSSHDL